jgi:hypothetical protein
MPKKRSSEEKNSRELKVLYLRVCGICISEYFRGGFFLDATDGGTGEERINELGELMRETKRKGADTAVMASVGEVTSVNLR